MTMAPSADMFELGVKVQVLKRGTMFAARAATLYSLYTRFPSLDAIPAEELARIEKQLFRQPVGEVWARRAQILCGARPPRNRTRRT